MWVSRVDAWRRGRGMKGGDLDDGWMGGKGLGEGRGGMVVREGERWEVILFIYGWDCCL